MTLFFKTHAGSIIAVGTSSDFIKKDIDKLRWLFGDACQVEKETITGFHVGPRREMITPWSTNAVEITQNMGINGISRIEEYFPVESETAEYDPMLQRMYKLLDQKIFFVDKKPQPIRFIDNIELYSEQEGLAQIGRASCRERV